MTLTPSKLQVPKCYSEHLFQREKWAIESNQRSLLNGGRHGRGRALLHRTSDHGWCRFVGVVRRTPFYVVGPDTPVQNVTCFVQKTERQHPAGEATNNHPSE